MYAISLDHDTLLSNYHPLNIFLTFALILSCHLLLGLQSDHSYHSSEHVMMGSALSSDGESERSAKPDISLS